MIRLAIVDDDSDFHKLFKAHFSAEIGTKITYISTYLEAVATFLNKSFDLYLIDLNLDGYSGLELVKILQREKHIENRIVLMSQDMEQGQAVEAYSLGVSNVIDKPLDFEILKAILMKNIRMVQGSKKEVLRFGSFVLNTLNYTCFDTRKDQLIHLTATEFKIVERLILSSGRVVPKVELCDLCSFDKEPMTFKALEMQIVSIRKKICYEEKLIKTTRGVGYMMDL